MAEEKRREGPRLSLKHILTIPFVALILVVALVVTSLAYRASYAAVGSMADQLLMDIAERISQAIDSPLTRSRVILESAAPQSTVTPGLMDVDAKSLRERMWTATHLTPDAAYVYYGNERGQFYGVRRTRANSAPEWRVKESLAEQRRTFVMPSFNAPMELKDVEKSDKPYDARTRPWYTSAVAQKRALWAEVYVSFSTGELLMTRAKPIFKETGELEGVFATDVTLKSLSEYLAGLRITNGGVAYIVQRDGLLVAQSTKEPVYVEEGKKARRLSARDSKNEVIRSTYEAFAAKLRGGGTSGSSTHQITTSSGKTVFAALVPLADEDNLDWFAVVAAPEDDVLAPVKASLTRITLAAVLAALLALALGTFILNWVTRDLGVLTNAMRRVRDGQPYQPLELRRRDEIGELATNFESMQKSLHTDRLTGLYNREAFFKELNAQIRGAQAAGLKHPLAVLFGDLTKFKAVNDTLGHQVGDAVLIEYGKRFAASVRVGDIVARYAGDEYVALLVGVETYEQANVVIAKIDTAMTPKFESLKGSGLNDERIGGSFGVALYPQDGEDAESLVKAADAQMYARKFAANGGKGSRD